MIEPGITTVSLSSRRTNRAPGSAASALPSAESGLMRPEVWLGARSAFGLALPEARPTSEQLYAPRGVWIDDQRLIVCDSGNHRVLIWNEIPSRDGQAADIVLGQSDFESEGPAQGCQQFELGMHLPTGVIVADGKLLVADAWHHRILVWNKIPNRCNQRADYAIGQACLHDVLPNRGGQVDANTLYWPYGLSMIGGRLYVADTGNRRVLAWNGIPGCNEPAELVLGQTDIWSNSENRGGPVSDQSFRWPHAIAGDNSQLWIADAGNHRVLGWNHHPHNDCPANFVIGQADMVSNVENPYGAQSERVLRFPYGLASNDQCLIVADTANNRILFWQLPIERKQNSGAKHVLGQPDFDSAGENRWQSVTHDSLCWPYGIAIHRHRLAVADSGNNRVMLWDCSAIDGLSNQLALTSTTSS